MEFSICVNKHCILRQSCMRNITHYKTDDVDENQSYINYSPDEMGVCYAYCHNGEKNEKSKN